MAPGIDTEAVTSHFFFFFRYLESISFAFPLVLMISWVLFVANFVKKLVHERELRLHEVKQSLITPPGNNRYITSAVITRPCLK